jgi:hypothetical protein
VLSIALTIIFAVSTNKSSTAVIPEFSSAGTCSDFKFSASNKAQVVRRDFASLANYSTFFAKGEIRRLSRMAARPGLFFDVGYLQRQQRSKNWPEKPMRFDWGFARCTQQHTYSEMLPFERVRFSEA